jgi:hypothetical protein
VPDIKRDLRAVHRFFDAVSRCPLQHRRDPRFELVDRNVMMLTQLIYL